MIVTIGVNQREAIRRGFNCNSTVKLDVDVANLTQPQRERLAAWFNDGQLKIGHVSAEIPQPDIKGLIEFLDQDIAKLAKEDDRKRQYEAELDLKIQAFRKQFDAHPEQFVMWSPTRGTRLSGDYPFVSGYDSGSVSFYLTGEQQTRFFAIGKRLETEHDKRVSEAKAKAEKEEDQRTATMKANADRRQAQIRVFLDETGGTLAERYNQGFSNDDEVASAIGDRERSSRGVTFTGSEKEWSRDDSEEWSGPLTDDQFLKLKGWKAKLPVEATVRVVELFDYESDGYEGLNKDTKINRILVADAWWKVGEFDCRADFQIGELEDITATEE